MFLIHMFVSSNLHKLRDFIKHVYLDRKYTGDKRIDKLSKLRLVSSSLLYMHAHGSYLSWVALLDLLYEENQCSNPPSSTCNNWIIFKKKKIHFCLVESLSNNDLHIQYWPTQKFWISPI